MVHTGKPSGGCGVCRRRRIKCDEQRPECSYCIKTKQKCPGYINQFDLAWRDQTTVAQKNVQRHQHAREQARLEEDIQAMVPRKAVATSASRSNEFGKVLPRLYHENPEVYSINFFFTFYATPPNNDLERRAFFDYVVPLYFAAGENSTMRLSTLAVASVMFSGWMNRSADSALARMYYIKAVSAMKEQLIHPGMCDDDQMFMSVLLLQMYENLVGALGKPSSPHAHIDDRTSQGLLISVRSQAISNSLYTRRPVNPSLISSWESHITSLSLTPDDTLDTINARIANLYFSISRSHAVPELLTEAHSITTALSSWNTSLPLEWRPISVSGPVCIHASIPRYGSHAYVYSSICGAIAWNKYRLAVIQVHLAILSLSPSPNHDSNKSIQEAIDGICHSVPYFLGDRINPGPIGDKRLKYPHREGEEPPEKHYRDGPTMGGYQLLGPLGTLLKLKFEMRRGQREWIGGQMGRIAKVYNLGR